jgi:DNA-binding MarR family transcriptional regulator
VSQDYDIGAVDEVIHGRVRLGVMAYLTGAGGAAEFNEIKKRLNATDGNLSVHLMKLEEAGYVDIEKTYAGKKPLTRVHLNDAGRAAFSRYLEAINALLAPAAQ